MYQLEYQTKNAGHNDINFEFNGGLSGDQESI